MTSAESFDTEAIGVKNGGQEASKTPLYAVIGLAVLCAVLLIAVIALSIVLMGKDDIEGTDQPDSSGQTGSKHRAGDVEYPDIPEEDNSNVPSAPAPASSPLSRPPPASQSPGSPVPGSRPSPSSVAQPSSSNNPAPQPRPPVVATTANGPAVAATSILVDSSSANPNPPSPDSSATAAPDGSSENSTMNAPQGSNGNSSSAHGELSPGPVDDKLYDSNRTAKLSAINTEKGSVKLGDYMLSIMNRSVDPCDDFYNFVCGRFRESWLKKKNESGDADFIVRRRAVLHDKLYKTNHSTLKSAEYAKKYGTKCKEWMADRNSVANKKAVDELKLNMINDFLANSDIPFLTHSDGSNFSFSGSMLTAQSYGAVVLLQLEKSSYPTYINGSTVSTLFASSAVQTVLAKAFENSTKLLNTKRILADEIKTMADLKKVKLDDSVINNTAMDLMLFAKEHKKMMDALDMKLEIVTLSNTSLPALELDILAKRYNWSDNVQIMSIFGPNGMEMLSDFIEKSNKTTLANYFAVISLMQALANLEKVNCDEETANRFVGVMAYLNEELFPVMPQRKKVRKMLDDISEGMRKIFENSDWLTNETRAKAIEKLNATTNCIGYHDKFFNATEVDAFHAHLTFEDTDGFPMISHKVTSATLEKQLQNAGKFMDRRDFCLSQDLSMPNAFHHIVLNLLIINGGILQYPVVDDGIPESALYGALGAAVGHEFTHGYDNTGKDYGPYGQKMDWWTPEDNKKYNEKSKCLVDFFNSYIDPLTKLKENGTFTLGENIADLGGIKAALQAYRNFVTSGGKVPAPLPGLEDYTDEQAMFVSSAVLFCRELNATDTADAIKKDTHSLNRARVNSLATNTKEFADIFKCPLGSNHNPTHPRCEVW